MKRPKITIMCAASLDGRIVPGVKQSSKIFARYIPHYFTHKLMAEREKNEAIMVGSNTILIDNPSLLPRGKNKNKIRIVIDSKGRLNKKHKVIKDKFPLIVLVSKTTPNEYKEFIKNTPNKQIIQSGVKKVNLKKALKEIYDMGIRNLLVEGGGRTIWELIKLEAIDKVKILYLPFFVGDHKATSLVMGNKSIFSKIWIKISHSEVFKGFLFIEGGVKYGK